MNELLDEGATEPGGGSGCLKFIGLILVLGVVGSLCNTDDRQPANDPAPRAAAADQGARYSDTDIEYQLASIDAGRRLDADDPVIDRYKSVLDRAQRQCGDSRRFLGDMAVRSTELLADEGVSASAYEMLDGVAIALDGQATQDTCSDVFATLVALMVP